jgi:ketosteroid isomerase-like protein
MATAAAASSDDRSALHDLITAYAHAVDDRDVAGILACFAPDARLSANGGAAIMCGHDEIRDYFDSAFSRPELGPGSRSTHLLTNTAVAFTDDGAEIVTLANAAMAHEDTVRLRGVRYRDRCIRTTDGWQIIDRRHEGLWSADLPGHVIPAASPEAPEGHD